MLQQPLLTSLQTFEHLLCWMRWEFLYWPSYISILAISDHYYVSQFLHYQFLHSPSSTSCLCVLLLRPIYPSMLFVAQPTFFSEKSLWHLSQFRNLISFDVHSSPSINVIFPSLVFPYDKYDAPVGAATF